MQLGFNGTSKRLRTSRTRPPVRGDGRQRLRYGNAPRMVAHFEIGNVIGPADARPHAGALSARVGLGGVAAHTAGTSSAP